MPDEELAQIPQEGAIEPKEENKEVIPAVPPAEKETETPAPEGEKNQEETNLPFHQHPRWKALHKELKDLRTFKDEMVERFTQKEEEPAKPQNSSIPDWFVEIFGEQPSAWEKFSRYNAQTREQIKEEIFSELQSKAEEQQQQTVHWNQWVDKELQELGDDKGVDLTDKEGGNSIRNEIIKVAIKYKPTDEEGNIDLRAAYEIWQSTKKEDDISKVTAKKQVAGLASVKSKGESQPKDFMTSNDFRGKGWAQVVRE